MNNYFSFCSKQRVKIKKAFVNTKKNLLKCISGMFLMMNVPIFCTNGNIKKIIIRVIQNDFH